MACSVDAVRAVVDDAAMPPPKPGQAPQGDDDRRQGRDAAAEAERLGREHSNKREMKARAERMQAKPEQPRSTGVPGVPGAPVVQPRRPSESRVPDAEAQAPREGRTPAAPRPAERPATDRPSERPPERERPPPRPAPSPSPPAAPEQVSVIDAVAVEAEEMLREGGTLWRRFTVADKITLFSAMLSLVGTMLPWLRRAHEQIELGIAGGGVVHAVIACACVALLVRRERPALDDRGLRPSSAKQRQLARRTALWMLLLSLASTIAGTWFLIVYGMVRRFEVPTLEIGVGLYVTLAAGLGLSYSGFAYFWRSARAGER